MKNDKLKIIDIENFQSHSRTTLHLHEGVNVITGTSDTGKSAIMRALIWCVKNRPQGFAFHSTFADEGQPSRVALKFQDGQEVTRFRDEKSNQYSTHLVDKLEALRSEVPSEVSDIVNFEDYNLQSQFDKYFLLQSTAGEVVKKLNKVVGLEIITKSMKKIDVLARKASGKIETEKEIKKEKEESLLEFKNFKEIEKLVESLDKKIKDRDFDREKRLELQKIIRDIDSLDEEIQVTESWLEIEKEAEEIFKELDQLKYNRHKQKELQRGIDQIEKLDVEMAEHEEIVSLTDIAREAFMDQKRLKEITKILDDLEVTDSQIKLRERVVKKFSAVFNKTLYEIDYCPVCERDVVDDDMRNLILEYFKGTE